RAKTQHTGHSKDSKMIPRRAGSHKHVCVPACGLTVAGVCAGKERDKKKQQQQGGLLGCKHTAEVHDYPTKN
ncbi:hypothetical protein DUNSADRAFT_12958, partial [Dunaliella salina]